MSSWTNSNLREIFCLTTLLSTFWLLSTVLHSSAIAPYYSSAGTNVYRASHVSWRASLDDPNVYVLDSEIPQTLLFNPTAFTGSEFFSKAIREMILLDTSTDSNVYDLVGPQRDPMSFEYQARHLRTILGRSNLEFSSTFVVSNVHVSDLYELESSRPTRTVSVSFLRNPLHSFVSAFYYRQHSEHLYGRHSPSQSQEDFRQLLAKASREVEEYVSRNQDIRPFANDISAAALFCGENVTKCHGVHPGRAAWVLSQAKKRAPDGTYFVGILEDFHNIPGLLETISPLVCGGLRKHLNEKANWPPVWMGAKVNLSRSTIDALRQDNRMKLELRFYEWARQRYHQEKKKIIARKQFGNK